MSSVARYPAALVAGAAFAGTARAGVGEGSPLTGILLLMGCCWLTVLAIPFVLCLIGYWLSDNQDGNADEEHS